jgi:flavin reductase (DIM6/NTAB) family NADH-FMN oxidoreductase RutF
VASDIGEAEFRQAMSLLASAVSVVATGSEPDGSDWRGMTATAVCSLCAEPPSLLACLNRNTGTYRQLRRTEAFSVTVLAPRHVGLARIFAGQHGLTGAARFAAARWRPGRLAVPVLPDALASFECRVARSIEYGTHALLIGAVEAACWAERDTGPLVYHARRFLELGRNLERTGA